MMNKRGLIGILMLFVLAMLAACSSGGGGGGGGSAAPVTAPAAPSVTLNYDIKTLQFSWDAVSDATYYRLLENPDGVSGYTQVGSNLTATSVNHAIALHRRVNARYIVEACNAGGCTGSAPISLAANLVPAIGYVKASNSQQGDYFGTALVISGDGNTLAVGASSESSAATGIDGNQADNSAGQSGAVYIFARSGSTWSQQAYVKASNTEAADFFGWQLSLSHDGNTLAVGAFGEDSNASSINGDQSDNSSTNSGAVYVFARNSGVWSQQAYLKASTNSNNQARLGWSVALSGDGNTLAAGAPEDLNRSGAVYIFTRSGSTWTEQASVTASNGEMIDNFGYVLALSADGITLAVGAGGEDSNATGIDGNQADNSASSAGAVYLFTRSGSSWGQQAYVKASNTEASDFFGGLSVALSADGNTLAVGAAYEDSNATGIEGNQADNSATDAGAVYVFTRSGSSWSQQSYIKATNSNAGDQFGKSLALSADGNTLAVGADTEGSNATGIDGNQSSNTASMAGAVYTFNRSGAAWSPQAYVKASNTGAGDQFGASVALSADGGTLAVGAHSERSNATGINGDQSNNSLAVAGAVYLY